MFTISLHKIGLHAKIGLYPEEKITGNDFEVDVDITVNASSEPVPFIDYAIVHQIVLQAFEQEGELLETFVLYIHKDIKNRFIAAEKIRVAIRKMHPPLTGAVGYSQVCLEA